MHVPIVDHTVEFTGGESLPSAISELYTNDQTDLVVVRDYISDPAMLVALGNACSGEERATELLPSIEAAHEVVRGIWDEQHVNDFPVLGRPYLDLVRYYGVMPHIDENTNVGGPNKLLIVVAQLSICLSGARRVYAERRPSERFRDASNNFDYDEHKKEAKGAAEAERYPRSSAELRAGDLAIFSQFPIVSFHAVKQAEPAIATKSARLVNWYAKAA